MSTKVTSSGIVKNSEKPCTGIASQNSLCPDFIDEFIINGIDLGWEQFKIDVSKEVERDNPDLDQDALDDVTADALENYEADGSTYLLGAWIKGKDGTYSIDKSGKHGNFAACYSSHSGNVSVEWSVTTTPCNNTSPCYVMADGSGPCGDLDSPGDVVVAYTLPEDCWSHTREKEGE